MRIKKTAQTTTTQAQISDGYSTSKIDGYSCDYLNKATRDVYSETETKTNEIWIDGKPIYKKTIYISSLPNATSTTYNHLINNVDSIWCDKSNSYILFSDGVTANFNYLGTSGSGSFAAAIEIRAISSTSFSISTYSTNRSSAKGYVTLKYTKTTD